jgi:hypothetical protein
VPQRLGTAEVPKIEHLRSPSDRQLERSQGPRDPLIYLIAPMLAANAPFTEVLTVIGQQVVTVFTYSGTCPVNYFIAYCPETKAELAVGFTQPRDSRSSTFLQVAGGD